jgi:anti-sigma B factor antagonist
LDNQPTYLGLDYTRVVLDLSRLDYIDSSGLGALVALYMHAQRTGCDLEITNPKSRIKDRFSRSGLGKVFEGHDDTYGGWPIFL